MEDALRLENSISS